MPDYDEEQNEQNDDGKPKQLLAGAGHIDDRVQVTGERLKASM
jgi:hypothetical protein